MSSTSSNLPSVGKLIVAASRALEHYEAGDLPGALAALDGFEPNPLPDRPEWIATQFERNHAAVLAGQRIPSAALDCIALARDRIRKEMGEPVQFAVMPVPMALRTAPNALGAGV